MPRPQFTIASLNARWGLDLDDRPFGIADAVASFDTDVVAVQEVFVPDDDAHPLDVVVADGGYESVSVPLSPSFLEPAPEITRDPNAATGTWGIVLPSRLPILDVELVDLGRLMDRWDVADRTAIVATLDTGRAPVTVAVVHLSFALPNAVAQLRTLAGRLAGHPRSLVVGDFNLWGPVAASLLGGRRRAVRGRTWPAHRPHSQLDHVLLGEGLVAVDGEVLAPVGSDHLPIRATIAVR